ncbi:MAG: ribosome biogenesis GTP-binding protein YihA/YsxC [Bacillota bacterium]
MEPFRIRQAEFVTSMTRLSDYPADRLPEVAVAGKSNVGKSSLINALANNRKLAHISSRPGKTRFVNFFRINGTFYLVDLPGYGFSRVSKTTKQGWAQLVEGYLKTSAQLRHMYLLVDIRHDPTCDDVQMCDWLRHYGVGFTVVATKCDKIAKSKWNHHTRNIAKKLELNADTRIIPVSVPARIGYEELTRSIGEALGAAVQQG